MKFEKCCGGRPTDLFFHLGSRKRLGRSLKHLIEAINALARRKVGFQSLRESMDTTTSGGKLIFSCVQRSRGI
jgi:hypothetical protein